MTTKLSKKLLFFKECLAAETQSKALWNIYSRQCEYLHDLNLNPVSTANTFVLETKYSETLIKAVNLYQREKRLLACRFFIISEHEIQTFGGRTRKRNICCPIFYFPAQLIKHQKHQIAAQFDIHRGMINPAALQFFKQHKIDVKDDLQAILQCTTQTMETSDTAQYTQPLLKVLLYKLLEKLQTALPERSWHISHAEKNPPRELLKTIAADAVHISTATKLCLIRKQLRSQGVLHELNTMIERADSSLPLSKLLQEQDANQPPQPSKFWSWNNRKKLIDPLNMVVPVVLSQAQNKAMEVAAENSLSVMVGPPGTGKSFTIASLALSEFMAGHSVLIVSQNQHAVDVVRRKLIDDFGVEQGLTVLGSEKGVPRAVKNQILELINNHHPFDEKLFLATQERLRKILSQSDKAQTGFINSCLIQEGSIPAQSPNLLARFFNKLFNTFQTDTKLLLNEELENIEQLDTIKHRLSTEKISLFHQKIQSIATSNQSIRTSLSFFSKALSARTDSKRNEYNQSVNYADVFSILPFWFAPIDNLHQLLPLENGLFDIVIIDEATQCNMSVCLPAIYRAKRAVIVGDPKQLKHVSFVSYDKQQQLFNKHGLSPQDINENFRNNSVIDYALDAIDPSEQMTRLDEHFRSHPQIISFSNQHFYDNTLKVMTEKPGKQASPINIINCQGQQKRTVNRQEADAVITAVKELVQQQQSVSEQTAHTIGVLSFFSNQAEYLEKRIFDEFSLSQLRKHNIRCGTPFSFQGEERDQMFISCCVDADTSGATYNYLNRDDVFNVAITRARDHQTLFISCTLEQVNAKSKLKSYLQHCANFGQETRATDEVLQNDAFQNEVCSWLESKGVETFKNYRVAGTDIDIIAIYQGQSIAIDLIGFAGPLQGALELDRYKLLNRAGLPSFLLPYNEWKNDQGLVLAALSQKLGLSKEQALNQAKPDNTPFDAAQEAIFKQLFAVSLTQLQQSFIAKSDQRATKQLALISKKHQQYTQLLKQHFQPDELTYKRYLNAFDQLVLMVINSLKQVAMSFEITEDLLTQHDGWIKQNASDSMEDSEVDENPLDEVYQERLSLIDAQRHQTQQLLLDNESALLQIDKTIVKLANLNLHSNTQTTNINQASKILDDMTDKLDLYTNKTL